MMNGIFPFMTQQKRAMARREREGSPTIGDARPRRNDGDGHVLLDEVVVEPARLEDVRHAAHSTHHTTVGEGERDYL